MFVSVLGRSADESAKITPLHPVPVMTLGKLLAPVSLILMFFPSGHQAPKHKPSLIITHKIVTEKHQYPQHPYFLCTYPVQPVCTSLLFISLFIKSQYTVFCTSYCFAHLIVLHFLYCTFYSYFSFFYHIYALVLLLLYNSYFLILLHCPLSGPDLITFHF